MELVCESNPLRMPLPGPSAGAKELKIAAIKVGFDIFFCIETKWGPATKTNVYLLLIPDSETESQILALGYKGVAREVPSRLPQS